MMTRKEIKQNQKLAQALFNKAGIVITKKEAGSIEVADFGLSAYKQTGLAVLVYVNTDRCCAKELALLPRQTCPEHRHPQLGRNNPGKEETFRCRWGTIYLYVPGPKTGHRQARPPKSKASSYTVWHEIVLKSGAQYTLAPDTLHWFQAGPQGAVVSEFSTRSVDAKDIFTDREIQRITRIV
ncbi:MAG: D-lyxose/D-mannose family sugar isomerase [Kiritimatiellae bacterium]|nr:D-lyxose/D-mannose family sugar isomerase [Verrucomicrobiota bacterium]MCG2659063.1 D-lyxose/D-mannose family sugar isomerase [Kiritimatiellia bacterium]